jgi:hypothetical protein
MYASGTLVGVANAAMFHPVDSIRIRYFFLPRSKKNVNINDIRGVSFWKGIGTFTAHARTHARTHASRVVYGLTRWLQASTCSPRR